MRKIFFICLSLLVSATLFAQENKDGKMKDDILYLNNGIMLRKGSMLKLNGPLGEDSRFKYIHHAPDNLFDDMKASFKNPIEPYYATKDVTVRKIRYVGDKDSKDGKWVVRLRTDGKKDFICDIAEALSSGELSAMQVVDVTSPNQVEPVQIPSRQPATTQTVSETQQVDSKTAAPAFSVADELLKLKKLMDEGVISKEEFEAQKKKLLDQ